MNQGALNYSVALDLPKGVAGVAPKISLNYSSNSGNGLLGQGWSIGGLSSITRCGSTIADDGFNRAVQLDSKDNFCMDGQRLVHKTGKEFRTQIETYSKIVYTGSRTNPSKFTVWLKSGDIYEYRQTEIVSGKNITWYLSKIDDRYGNSISFNYTLHQHNTPIIKSISYGVNNKIIFSYSLRKDKISAYRFGQVYKKGYKLDDIKVESSGVEVKTYKLSYQAQNDTFDKLKLNHIKECVNLSCSEPLKFSWQENQEKVSFSSDYTFPNISVKKGDVRFLDLNNDGFTDMYQIKENEKDIVWINDKNGNFSKKFYIDSKEKNKNYQFFDFDNDGYVDVFVSGDKINYFWKNNGVGNFSKKSYITSSKDKKTYFLDFNSDNYTDIFMTGLTNPIGQLWSNTSKTFVKTGAFNLPKSPSITKWIKDYGRNSFMSFFNGGTSFADINQDGKMDVLVNVNLHAKQVVGRGKVNYFYRAIGLVFLNNGTGFTYSNEIDYGSRHTSKLYLDVNGDTVTDIIDSTNGVIYLSDSSLTWKKKSLGFSTNINNLKFIDFNHDGNLDILLNFRTTDPKHSEYKHPKSG